MSQDLDRSFWDNLYTSHETRWDIGSISTPIKEYIDQLTDKNISILIPGCGNAYEAEYLLQQGFTNITLIDLSPVLTTSIEQKFSSHLNRELKVICGNFFDIQEQFDLVLEQTFFCALDPSLRNKYANKMHKILKPGGKLVGVMFNCSFEGGPPFGGNKDEYEKLFNDKLDIKTMDDCYNSIEKRKGNELFVILRKA